jgi:hypothetical protein
MSDFRIFQCCTLEFGIRCRFSVYLLLFDLPFVPRIGEPLEQRLNPLQHRQLLKKLSKVSRFDESGSGCAAQRSQVGLLPTMIAPYENGALLNEKDRLLHWRRAKHEVLLDSFEACPIGARRGESRHSSGGAGRSSMFLTFRLLFLRVFLT